MENIQPVLPQQLDPNKYHVFDKKRKRLFVMFAIFVLLVVFPIFGYLYYGFAINRASQTSNEIAYEIRGGSSVTEISEELAGLGAVNSAFLFKFYLVSHGLQSSIQAGIYVIPAGTSVIDLAEMFQHGVTDLTITFVEGWRVEEYARLASKEFKNIDYDEFVKVAKEREGFLFPDTYSFNQEVTEEEMLDAMEENFNSRTSEILSDEKLQSVGISKDEAVIFASIVEREVNNEEDRPKVAGILINRWKSGETLGADATVQYAIAQKRFCFGDVDCTSDDVTCRLSLDCPTEEQAFLVDWWPESLTVADLDYDSPYNTRKNLGLPPTPISNPGLSAIEAVVNYEDSEYSYYLTDEDGVTHYAKTLNDHNKNILDYLQ